MAVRVRHCAHTPTPGRIAALVCLVAGLLTGGRLPVHAATATLATLALNRDTLAEQGALTFTPGQAHVLRVTPDWSRLADEAVLVTVVKWLPDGRCDEERIIAPRGQSREFALGPLTAPTQYEFQAGVMYRRGYRLEITLRDTSAGRVLSRQVLCQAPAREATARSAGDRIKAGPERFVPGTEDRAIYYPHLAVETALDMRLSDKVLRDPDQLTVLSQLNPGAGVAELDCELAITAADGKVMVHQPIHLGPAGAPTTTTLDPASWPVGDYRVRLCPVLAGKAWDEGPRLTYRRRAADPQAVPISPLAPWTLQRDPARQELAVLDLRQACSQWAQTVPPGWQFEGPAGRVSVVCPPGVEVAPLELRLPLTGHYAVFATPAADGCLVQVGDAELVRPTVAGTRGEVFVCATDMTAAIVRVFAATPFGTARSGLQALRLVPVTEPSVKAFLSETSQPPVPLYGVNDWMELYHGMARLAADQFTATAGAEAELGLRTLDWSIGRSWVEYHSTLPNATRFPAVPLAEAVASYDKVMIYAGRAAMLEKWDPLAAICGTRERSGSQVWPWLSMNRHYGKAYGGIFASHWFREHPEWHDWLKNAKAPAGSTVCYFFPEVRQERIDILLEVARRGVDGLLIGCCRQVPMLTYHPAMVARFRQETGIDPQTIDGTNTAEYLRWIKWRAEFFTQLLRDLRGGLREIEGQRGRRIPLAVRIPSTGLFLNLAQGLDLETWVAEGLVDVVQLDPLETCSGEGGHDVRPYLELCRPRGVPVLGGIGATWPAGGPAHVAAMHRALGLLEVGVDGIEIYETEILTRCSAFRWILPLFGNRERLRRFLAESNIEACFPLTAASAYYGHDNHSRWGKGGWRVSGREGYAL